MFKSSHSDPWTDAPGTSNPAKTTPGTAPRRASLCKPFRRVITGYLEASLHGQRIWQDLRYEHGFTGSYSSVKRFIRRLGASTPLPYRRISTEPGQEVQVDFGTGAWVVEGKRKRRPHVLRVTLSCSRKSYSEPVFGQTTENFIRCLENAFRYFGGVTRTIVIDNLRAAVKNADWFDPELNPRVLDFARHYDTVFLPTRPYTPRHKGKVESGVKYVKNNALKGRVFTSLEEQRRFLAKWDRNVADTRIQGTTRRQVRSMFEEERGTLLPLPSEPFPFYHEAGARYTVTATWRWPGPITPSLRSTLDARYGSATTAALYASSTTVLSR